MNGIGLRSPRNIGFSDDLMMLLVMPWPRTVTPFGIDTVSVILYVPVGTSTIDGARLPAASIALCRAAVSSASPSPLAPNAFTSNTGRDAVDGRRTARANGPDQPRYSP